MDKNAAMLSRAAAFDRALDDDLWKNGSYHEKDFPICDSYEDEIAYMKTYLDTRLAYLDRFFGVLG